MPDLSLNILVVPTYSTKHLSIQDVSTYPIPVSVDAPTIEITPPGFDKVILDFTIQEINTFTSVTLETSDGDEEQDIPDGIYYLKYSVNPSATYYVEKSIIRIDKLQEKFDSAFMTLEMMVCDSKIKSQSKVVLNHIWFLIQGALAAANKCATEESVKLYNKADQMLNRFIANSCGCSGHIQTITYY